MSIAGASSVPSRAAQRCRSRSCGDSPARGMRIDSTSTGGRARPRQPRSCCPMPDSRASSGTLANFAQSPRPSGRRLSHHGDTNTADRDDSRCRVVPRRSVTGGRRRLRADRARRSSRRRTSDPATDSDRIAPSTDSSPWVAARRKTSARDRARRTLCERRRAPRRRPHSNTPQSTVRWRRRDLTGVYRTLASARLRERRARAPRARASRRARRRPRPFGDRQRESARSPLPGLRRRSRDRP